MRAILVILGALLTTIALLLHPIMILLIEAGLFFFTILPFTFTNFIWAVAVIALSQVLRFFVAVLAVAFLETSQEI